ncbi:MAG: NAD(P)-binding domain-containing protein [Terracidiphilus sp.]|jgi:6-phosphogluconate dehydrogenase (decarboxylating)
MQLGLIGLGKMGGNMAERLKLAGHQVVGFDFNADAVAGLNVSAPVITESVIRRIRSREENNFTDRMLAIMRNEFGGHEVKKS